MEDSKKVKVINRAGNGTVGYKIPDMGNLERIFYDGEEKVLTFEEIRKLSYIPGGRVLLEQYLVIEDKDVLKEIDFNPEPEYFYTKEDIKRLMTEGSLDEFLDCLDFGPEGVQETIKEMAVSLPLNDVAKRKAILDKLGFNVDSAIRIKEQSEEEEKTTETTVAKPVGQRRAAARSNGDGDQSKSSQTSARRVVKD